MASSLKFQRFKELFLGSSNACATILFAEFLEVKCEFSNPGLSGLVVLNETAGF